MKKNKRLLIIVGVLLLVGGISMAYFVGKMLTSGEGASTSVITANIKNSEVKVEGTLQFPNYEGMLPGHKEPSIIKVTAIGDNELIPYNVVWKGRNGLGTSLNFTIYRLDESITISAKCEEVREKVSGGIALSEKCSITNEDKLGNPIGKGTIESGEELSVTLAERELITSTEGEGTVVYYYIVLEYPNENDSQNEDMGENFDGEVTIEASNAKPDIDIVAISVEQEDGSYKETDDIPDTSKYKLNIEKSTCNNNSKAIWSYENKGVTITNLKQKGTQCYLQFDKIEFKTSEEMLASLDRSIIDGPTSFTTVDTTEHIDNNEKTQMFKAEDDFGDSYYFRGKVKDNWVQFGQTFDDKNIYWRIIRINGDGSLRLIYAGTGETADNLTPSDETNKGYIGNSNSQINNNALIQWVFGGAYSDNKYVGYEWDNGKMHSYGTGKEENKSNVLKNLDIWFGTNLKDEFASGNGWIDTESIFCNDRSGNNNSGYESIYDDAGGTGKIVTYYGAYKRLFNKQNPTFKCSTNYTNPSNPNNVTNKEADSFTYTGASRGTKSLIYPIGTITADEVVFAGGLNSLGNNLYYLFINSTYWTMSPHTFDGTYASVFYVSSMGSLENTGTNSQFTLRPVINLKSSTQFEGTGLYNDPYTVIN